MKLVLASSSFINKLPDELTRLLGESLQDKKVVIIPNAGKGKEKMEMVYEKLEEYSLLHDMWIKLVDLDITETERIKKSLLDTDIVVFTGGLVSHLLKAIDQHNLRNLIINTILKEKFVMGFSAGAMVMSKTQHVAKNYIGEPDPEVEGIEGLGVIDFEVYPHYTPEAKDKIREHLPKDLTVNAIEDGEAIIIAGENIYFTSNEIRIQ